jgi:hypothetical protein
MCNSTYIHLAIIDKYQACSALLIPDGQRHLLAIQAYKPADFDSSKNGNRMMR